MKFPLISPMRFLSLSAVLVLEASGGGQRKGPKCQGWRTSMEMHMQNAGRQKAGHKAFIACFCGKMAVEKLHGYR